MEKDLFEEFVNSSDPNIREKAQIWKTAIGLQKVDGLKTSEYLKEVAIKNIEGVITFDEAQELLNAYSKRAKKTELKKPIKFLPELQRFYRKRLSVFLQMNIFLFIKNYLMVSMIMQVFSAIIILPKKNGY